MDRALIGNAISIVVLVAAILGIIYPAIVDPHISLTQIILSLFHPDWSYGFAARWLIVLVFVMTLYALIVGRIYSETPVTILSSVIEIKYLNADGSRASLTRTQTLRANQRGVTAFFNRHGTSAGAGRVLKASVSVSAFNDAVSLENKFDVYGQENRSIEVIHMFGRPLPYAWFMPMVPVWLISGEYENIKWFRKYVVKRTNTVIYENEFNTDAVMQFQADVYPTHNILIALDFSQTKFPPQETIKALRIKNYAVVPLAFEYRPSDRKIIVRLNKLQSERIRISWPIAADLT